MPVGSASWRPPSLGGTVQSSEQAVGMCENVWSRPLLCSGVLKASPPSVCVCEPPYLQVVWIVFGGYYVNQGNVPWPLRWLPSASLIKQGFQVRVGQNTAGRGRGGADEVTVASDGPSPPYSPLHRPILKCLPHFNHRASASMNSQASSLSRMHLAAA